MGPCSLETPHLPPGPLGRVPTTRPLRNRGAAWIIAAVVGATFALLVGLGSLLDRKSVV